MINWSEERQPNKDCRYNHVMTNLPFLGGVYIEWKGWKDYKNYSCFISDEYGEIVVDVNADTLEDAKNDVYNQYKVLVNKALDAIS